MRILDLFCGAGGAGMGYFKAGFEVVGVDNRKRNYPFEFIQMDAFEAIQKYGKDFDAFHASPPCQGYSVATYSKDSKYVPTRGKSEPKLINSIREEFLKFDKPYVIENVTGAKDSMLSPHLLCGRMFNLPIPRHRLFETNWEFKTPEHPKCRGYAKKYAKEHNIEYRDMTITGKGRHAGTSERWKSFLGITWEASQAEIIEMIPPAYTQHIGEKLLEDTRFILRSRGSF